jgi:16S rRNA (cytosine967-C5)-methyltransferase
MKVLLAIERRRLLADEVLDRTCARTNLDARDRALVLELVYGVLRHRTTLDWRLACVATRPLDRLPTPVLMALRLGAYQLLHLSRIPASAAVNESVSLVKRAPDVHWTGFVNAVLRALLREPVPAWPDPKDDPAQAHAIRYGCPRWLADRWMKRFGADQAALLCRATLEVPPLSLRANTLQITREGLQGHLMNAGYAARPTTVSPVGLILEKRGPVTDLPLFYEGTFYVEDEAAQLVAPILDPQAGERVLDACAAPGGKATHLAALMHNKGEIIALDRHPHRLRLLQENCRRLGIEIVRAVRADASQALPSAERSHSSEPARLFDRVLVDAPCSGLGVLRRHPEGKWQKDEGMLARQHTTQLGLLDRVCRALRPGGVLVYSTCSTEPEENEQVIELFCGAHPEFTRESVAPWLPPSGHGLVNAYGDLSTMFSTQSMDAFFAARLRKDASSHYA